MARNGAAMKGDQQADQENRGLAQEYILLMLRKLWDQGRGQRFGQLLINAKIVDFQEDDEQTFWNVYDEDHADTLKAAYERWMEQPAPTLEELREEYTRPATNQPLVSQVEFGAANTEDVMRFVDPLLNNGYAVWMKENPAPEGYEDSYTIYYTARDNVAQSLDEEPFNELYMDSSSEYLTTALVMLRNNYVLARIGEELGLRFFRRNNG